LEIKDRHVSAPRLDLTSLSPILTDGRGSSNAAHVNAALQRKQC